MAGLSPPSTPPREQQAASAQDASQGTSPNRQEDEEHKAGAAGMTCGCPQSAVQTTSLCFGLMHFVGADSASGLQPTLVGSAYLFYHPQVCVAPDGMTVCISGVYGTRSDVNGGGDNRQAESFPLQPVQEVQNAEVGEAAGPSHALLSTKEAASHLQVQCWQAMLFLGA